MRKNKVYTLQAKVAFKLADVIFPERETIFANITEEIEITGKISFISDGGNGKKEFAIVDVPGITMPVIVPKDKIQNLSINSSQKEHQRVARAI